METYAFNASREPVGRLATKIATILMGKHRPTFERHVKPPVKVIVTHSDQLVLTGKKDRQKLYYRHSGYIGHLKTLSAGWMRERDSRRIIRLAVSGMLPKNRLRTQLLQRLVIYRRDQPPATGRRRAANGSPRPTGH